MTGFSHSAVILFFVLSGYLVGGKALRLLVDGSNPDARTRFIVDRFARVVAVLWPALVLAGVVALLAPRTAVLTTANWAGPNPSILALNGVRDWVGTALLLNETITGTVAFDSPLWSLAFEWIYYLIAAGAICLAARDRRPIGVAAIGWAVLAVVLCLALRPLILGLFSCWLMGAAATRVRRGVPGWVTVPLFLAALGYARLHPQGVWLDMVVAAATALLLSTRGVRDLAILPRTGAGLAGFSFSLYATHVPVLLACMAGMQSAGLFVARQRAGATAAVGVAALLAVSYGVAFFFSLAFERRTDRLRGWLLRRREPVAGAQRPVSNRQ